MFLFFFECSWQLSYGRVFFCPISLLSSWTSLGILLKKCFPYTQNCFLLFCILSAEKHIGYLSNWESLEGICSDSYIIFSTGAAESLGNDCLFSISIQYIVFFARRVLLSGRLPFHDIVSLCSFNTYKLLCPFRAVRDYFANSCNGMKVIFK